MDDHGPFLEAEEWTEEDEIPWDYDAGESLALEYDDFEVDD